MTIQEAAHRLGKSNLTIRRWIKSGKLSATMINSKWDIPESALSDISEDISDDISSINQNNIIDKAHLLEEIQFLRKENERLRKQIDEKDRILEDSRQRQDTIIMQLTRQLDNQLKLLEYKRVPWYRKWFRKKPSPEMVTWENFTNKPLRFNRVLWQKKITHRRLIYKGPQKTQLITTININNNNTNNNPKPIMRK